MSWTLISVACLALVLGQSTPPRPHIPGSCDRVNTRMDHVVDLLENINSQLNQCGGVYIDLYPVLISMDGKHTALVFFQGY